MIKDVEIENINIIVIYDIDEINILEVNSNIYIVINVDKNVIINEVMEINIVIQNKINVCKVDLNFIVNYKIIVVMMNYYINLEIDQIKKVNNTNLITVFVIVNRIVKIFTINLLMKVENLEIMNIYRVEQNVDIINFEVEI